MSFCISIEAAVSIIESYNTRRDMHFKNVSCKIMLPSVQRSLGFIRSKLILFSRQSNRGQAMYR